MHRPDDEFINQFREKFGDLLLSCHGERGMAGTHVDAGDPMLPASYVNENEPNDVKWRDEANIGRTLRLESGSPKSQNFHAPDPFSPIISAKKHKTFHDRNLPGSGAVFHNKAGDLRSPLIRCNTEISPFLDESMQRVQQISWNGPNCFTPLAESQRWLCDNTYSGQAGDTPRSLMHRDSGYATQDGADQHILTGNLIAQPDLKFDLATSEAHSNDFWPYGDEEKYA